MQNTISARARIIVGMLDLQVPKTSGYGDTLFYLTAIERSKRYSGVVRNAAVLFAIGIDWQGVRSVLGVSAATSEADIHRRSFLESLVERKLRGGVFFVADDLSGLKFNLQAVFTSVKWQSCQFHLSQNSVRHAPNEKIKKSFGDDLIQLYNTENLKQTQIALVDKYYKFTPKRVVWLEMNVLVTFTDFSILQNLGRNMKPSKIIERAVNQQIKRRTRKVRIFPDEASLLRLVTSN